MKGQPVPHPATHAPLLAVGLISALALAYEILLTRLFAIIHWHHLVATSISLALLGFGASGSFLAIAGDRLRQHFAATFVVNALLFAFSTIACVALAQRLPFDPEALSWDWQQSGLLLSAFLLLAIPFFSAANCIGIALWTFDSRISSLYGFDLIGAGIGAFALLLGLTVAHPEVLLFALSLGGVGVAIYSAWSLHWHPRRVSLAGLLLLAGASLSGGPDIAPAAYKDLARSLAVLGAHLISQQSSPAGVISLVRNEQVPLRHAQGLSLHTEHLPPAQLGVFVDGDLRGAIDAGKAGPAQDAYLRDTTSALPFVLLQAPRVAVLNAGAGTAVRQALLLGARHVTAIERDAQYHKLLCVQRGGLDPRLCDGARVSWRAQAPRTQLMRENEVFDLISMELNQDIAGLDALQVDFDLTEQALTQYLGRLDRHGILAIGGPTRLPPRLALRMLDTARRALIHQGIDQPAGHIAMIRGWQRFQLVASPQPLGQQQLLTIRAFAQRLGFDLVWLPGMGADEANRFQQLREAYFHQAARHLLGLDLTAADAINAFRLHAVSDDRPFPHRFDRWGRWWDAIARGDREALAQIDIGLSLGVATLLAVSLIAIILIIVPLYALGSIPGRGGPRPMAATLGYFGLIGVAFLLIEIALIQHLQLYLGHPVYAATAVLAAFLVFAGLGSLWSQRRTAGRSRFTLRLGIGAIVILGLGYILYLPAVLAALTEYPLSARIAIALALMAPLAFAMGLPFPLGLHALGQQAPQLIPWAWGINGCASVISAAATPLLAMEIGFSGLVAVALLAYLCLPWIRLGNAGPADVSNARAAS